MGDDKRVVISIPLETLLSAIQQLPAEVLLLVKEKAEECLRQKAHSLPPVVNDPTGAFWMSELGQMILREADETVSLERVRQILGKLRGSLAEDILQERGER